MSMSNLFNIPIAIQATPEYNYVQPIQNKNNDNNIKSLQTLFDETSNPKIQSHHVLSVVKPDPVPVVVKNPEPAPVQPVKQVVPSALMSLFIHKVEPAVVVKAPVPVVKAPVPAVRPPAPVVKAEPAPVVVKAEPVPVVNAPPVPVVKAEPAVVVNAPPVSVVNAEPAVVVKAPAPVVVNAPPVSVVNAPVPVVVKAEPAPVVNKAEPAPVHRLSSILSNSTHEVKNNDVVNTIKNNDVVNTIKKNDVVNTIKNNDAVNTIKKNDVVNTIKNNDVVNTIKKNDAVNTIKNNDVVNTIKKNDVVNTVNKIKIHRIKDDEPKINEPDIPVKIIKINVPNQKPVIQSHEDKKTDKPIEKPQEIKILQIQINKSESIDNVKAIEPSLPHQQQNPEVQNKLTQLENQNRLLAQKLAEMTAAYAHACQQNKNLAIALSMRR
jgi:hypothetical protein